MTKKNSPRNNESNKPSEPGLDVFAVAPPGGRTLVHEVASGRDGSYEIAIFEVRGEDAVMWVVRKRVLFTVESNGRELFAPSWTTELHLTQLDLQSIGKMMLGNIIGKVSGESLQVSATRDQVMMDLRVRLKEHFTAITDARDNAHLHEIICALQSNADCEEEGGVAGNADADYQAFLSTIRMTAGLVASQMREREEE